MPSRPGKPRARVRTRARSAPGPDRTTAARRTALPPVAAGVLFAGVGAFGIVLLVWASRSAPFGTPVADDYAFLARLRFQHPLSWLDSMGAAFYWRPVSRQLWFGLVSPVLFTAPAIAAALNAALLVAAYALLARTLARIVPPPAAALIAAFPLLAEPARALLVWPSGSQHLLGMLGVALAVHEAAAGRLLTTALATAFGLLSHESALLAIPAVLLVRGRASRDLRSTARWAIALLGVVALWLGGYALARGHGVLLPAAPTLPLARGAPDLLRRFALAALNLEDADPAFRRPFAIAYILLAVLSLVPLAGRAARARLAALWPLPVACAGLAVLGALPLARLLPDWNAWRAFVPSVFLGVAIGAWLAIASPALVAGFVVLRVVALLLAPQAARLVAVYAPATTSDLSFVRIARLQRIVSPSRDVILARYPRLPAGTIVRYQNVPRMANVGFHGESAVQVWYADTTLRFEPFGGREGYRWASDAVLSYMPMREPICEIEDAAIRSAYGRALDAMDHERLDEADSLLTVAERLQTPPPFSLLGWIMHNRAIVELRRGHVARADTLNRESWQYTSDHPSYYALGAYIAMTRRDTANALRQARVCLQMQPDHGIRDDATKWTAAWSGRRR